MSLIIEVSASPRERCSRASQVRRYVSVHHSEDPVDQEVLCEGLLAGAKTPASDEDGEEGLSAQPVEVIYPFPSQRRSHLLGRCLIHRPIIINIIIFIFTTLLTIILILISILILILILISILIVIAIRILIRVHENRCKIYRRISIHALRVDISTSADQKHSCLLVTIKACPMQ